MLSKQPVPPLHARCALDVCPIFYASRSRFHMCVMYHARQQLQPHTQLPDSHPSGPRPWKILVKAGATAHQKEGAVATQPLGKSCAAESYDPSWVCTQLPMQDLRSSGPRPWKS